MESTEDPLARVSRVLRETQFDSVAYVGPINNALDMDCFVISMPKCGTTALQRGLGRVGHNPIHAHNNPTTFESITRGDVLISAGIDLETILKARLAATPRPLHFFFGYREPVSWYLSMAGHFALPLDDVLEQQIVQNMAGLPFSRYTLDETAGIALTAFGIDILAEPFDPEAGISLTRRPGVNLVCYRFDRMQAVRDYICANVDARFELTWERVNDDDAYKAYRDSFAPSDNALETLYGNRWFRHFYSAEERDVLIAAYRAKRRAKELR